MSFKEMVEAANHKTFLDTDKFAEKRTVKYNGETYEDIPIILAAVTEKDRRVTIMENGRRDNAQGLFMVTAVLRCALVDLRGKQPEQLQRIKINDREGGGGFFMEYKVCSSECNFGMLRVELEAIDE